MARNLGVPYTNKKPYYFISYNSEDEKNVAKYVKALHELGVPIWYDNGIKTGDIWETEIADRIDNCQAVIMFLSKGIFLKEDSYVQKEFKLARDFSAKELYIVMLDEISNHDVPIRFRMWWTEVSELQCINAYSYNSPADCAKKLFNSANIKNVVKNLIQPLPKVQNTKSDDKAVLKDGNTKPSNDAKIVPKNSTSSKVGFKDKLAMASFPILSKLSKTINNTNATYKKELKFPPKFVFISYSSYDMSFVAHRRIIDELIKHIESQGIKTWLLCKDIKPGQNYNEVILAAIKNCTVMLPFVSTHYVKSVEAVSEVAAAKQHKKPIMPILIENFELFKEFPNWAYMLKQYQCTNLYDAKPADIKKIADNIVKMVEIL